MNKHRYDSPVYDRQAEKNISCNNKHLKIIVNVDSGWDFEHTDATKNLSTN